MLLGDFFNFLQLASNFEHRCKSDNLASHCESGYGLVWNFGLWFFRVVFAVVFELFQTFVQGGVLKYTSQFLTTCDDHANLCWLKDLLTCGRKDLPASCSGTLRCTCVVVSEDLSYFFSMHVCM